MTRVLSMLGVLMVCLLTGWFATSFEGPEVVYALDDPYIHLSVARHFVEDGVWGITDARTSSASSSLMWTWLLALCWSVAPWDGWPLVLGACMAVLATIGVSRALEDAVPTRHHAWLVWCIWFVVGLPALLLTGLEHLLHIALFLGWMRCVQTYLESPRRRLRLSVGLALLAAALVFTRLESLFILVVTAAVMVWRRRWDGVLVSGMGGALAFAVCVWVNVETGAGVLPNSVVAKSGMLHASGLVGGLLSTVMRIPANVAEQHVNHVGTLVAMCGALALVTPWDNTTRDRDRVLSAVVLGTAVLHLAFSRLGWLFRYEAYLIVLGTIALVRLAPLGWRERSPVTNTVVGLAGVLLVVRGGAALHDGLLAPHDIYGQHIQMSRALGQALGVRRVAANDVGAISFYNTLDVTDLIGLGDDAVLMARREGRYGKDFAAELCDRRGVELAVVYEDWFQGGRTLPSSWVAIEDWELSSTTVAGSPRVTWFSVGAPPSRIRQRLSTVELPATVKRTPR